MEFARAAATPLMTPPSGPRAGREDFFFREDGMLYVYLTLGGVVGTLARYGLGGWVHSWAGAAFPWGTLAVNVAGSFLLGVSVRGADLLALSPEVRGLIMIGFCGAFTTFSTFSLETVSLMQEGAWSRAALYSLGSVALGLAAVAAGLSAANVLIPTGG